MNEEKKEIILFNFIIILVLAILVQGAILLIQYSKLDSLSKELVDQQTYFSIKTEDLENQINTVENLVEATAQATQKNFDLISGEIKGVQKESLAKIISVQKEFTEKGNGDFTQLIQDTLPAVVSIKTNTGVGSGVIVHPHGYIITNYHVVKNALTATVTTYDKTEYSLNVIASDANTDLAVLEIKSSKKDFPFLEFSEEMVVGERVLALGNPGGLDFSATQGIISATERKGPNDILYVQSDVPINPGNSGGPLINKQGKVLGINTLKVRGFEGVGFAIHARLVKEMIDNTLRGK